MIMAYETLEYFEKLLLKETEQSHRRAVFIGYMNSILDPKNSSGNTPTQILKRARNLSKAYQNVQETK